MLIVVWFIEIILNGFFFLLATFMASSGTIKGSFHGGGFQIRSHPNPKSKKKKTVMSSVIVQCHTYRMETAVLVL